MKLPDLPPLNHVPSMDLDQFHHGEKAVSELACQNYARLYALAYGEMVREECAKQAASFAACPCNGEHRRCTENDRPRATPAPADGVHGWTVADPQELRRLAEEAAAENDVESDWFDADLIESDDPILSSRKARRFIAAMTPQMAMRLIVLADRDARCVAPTLEGKQK